MRLFVWFLMLLVLKVKSFRMLGSDKSQRMMLNMRWSFTSATHSPGDQINNFCGSDGAFYYQPAVKAKFYGKQGELMTLPIYPSTGNILLPQSTEIINVFEMRHRELFSRVQDKYFAYSFVSQQKIALVGTIARVVKRKLCNDGRFYATVEGIERFYISDIKSDKPFISGNVQVFYDTISNVELIDELERKLFQQVRINIKLMYLLSRKIYASNLVLFRPYLSDSKNIRVVNTDENTGIDRRTKFSFAIMDILDISNNQKLVLMQETVLERRYIELLSLLEKCEVVISKELKSKGIITDEQITSLKQDSNGMTDFLNIIEFDNLFIENYTQDQDIWTQQSILM